MNAALLRFLESALGPRGPREEQGVARLTGPAPRLQQLGHEAGPAGLVRGADAATGVAMEVLMEEHAVLEVRIGGEFRMILERRAPAILVFEEEAGDSLNELVGRLVDRDEFSRAGRAFDFEIITVVVMEFLQRLDQEIIH